MNIFKIVLSYFIPKKEKRLMINIDDSVNKNSDYLKMKNSENNNLLIFNNVPEAVKKYNEIIKTFSTKDFAFEYYNSPDENQFGYIHKLRIAQPFFNDVFYNRKDFLVTKNDRDYKVLERIQLIEFGENIERPRYVLKDIKYIFQGGQYGIDKEYVILGLKEAQLNARFPPLTSSVDNSIKAEIALEKIKSKIQR